MIGGIMWSKRREKKENIASENVDDNNKLCLWI